MFEVRARAEQIAQDISLHLRIVESRIETIRQQFDSARDERPFADKWEIPLECEPADSFRHGRSAEWDAALRVGIELEDTGDYFYHLEPGVPAVFQPLREQSLNLL